MLNVNKIICYFQIQIIHLNQNVNNHNHIIIRIVKVIIYNLVKQIGVIQNVYYVKKIIYPIIRLINSFV